jgi:hypothetical protein
MWELYEDMTTRRQDCWRLPLLLAITAHPLASDDSHSSRNTLIPSQKDSIPLQYWLKI